MTTSGWRGDALGGVARNAGEPQQRQHVDVVPLEGHRERDDVEVADRRLRFERQQRRLRRRQLGQLLLRRQEEPLADDVVLGVEQAVDRLEAEVRHPDPVGVRETPARRADDRRAASGRSRFPSRGCAVRVRAVPRTSCGDPACPAPGRGVRALTLRRRRSRVPWIYLLYHRERRPPSRSDRLDSALLAAQERRHVERRAEVEVGVDRRQRRADRVGIELAVGIAGGRPAARRSRPHA